MPFGDIELFPQGKKPPTDPDEWLAQRTGQAQPTNDVDSFVQQHQGGTGIFAPGAMANAQIAPPPTFMQRMRQNLPSIGGFVGGTAAALSAPLWAPSAPLVIPAVAALSAGGGAAIGNEAKNMIRGMQGLPTPPTAGERLKEDLSEGITSGVLPELTGQGLGYLGGKAANVAMRPFARGRNAKLLDKVTNPQGLPFREPQSGAEYGQPFQVNANTNYRMEKGPLEQEYTKLYEGPFGKARELVRAKGGRFAQGSTIKELASERSDMLAKGRTAKEAGMGVIPRSKAEASAEAGRIYKRIETTAKRYKMSTADYDKLNEAWGQMEGLYGTKVARQVRRGMKGTDVIDILSSPKRWRTFMQGSSETPVDAPGLLENIKGMVDEPTWKATQSAVQKNILYKSSKGGTLNGATLKANLDELEKHLGPKAKDLAPALDKLKEVADIFRKSYGTPDAPDILNRKVTLLQWALKNLHMETPDLTRIMKQRNPKELDIVEQVLEGLTRTTNVAGRMAATPSEEEPLPNPPQR